jgi:hypothetical protein
MPRVGSEPTIPAFERAKTVYTLNRAATVIGYSVFIGAIMFQRMLHTKRKHTFHAQCTSAVSLVIFYIVKWKRHKCHCMRIFLNSIPIEVNLFGGDYEEYSWIWRRVVSYNFTNVSEQSTASIFRVSSSCFLLRGRTEPHISGYYCSPCNLFQMCLCWQVRKSDLRHTSAQHSSQFLQKRDSDTGFKLKPVCV